jgi:hypothetical protein
VAQLKLSVRAGACKRLTAHDTNEIAASSTWQQLAKEDNMLSPEPASVSSSWSATSQGCVKDGSS